jgi:hypothetical protein
MNADKGEEKATLVCLSIVFSDLHLSAFIRGKNVLRKGRWRQSQAGSISIRE